MTDSFFILFIFLFSLLLFIVYFNKRRINTLENKIYALLTLVNFINVVSLTINTVTIKYYDFIPITNNIINKFVLLCYFLWLTIFTMYIFFMSTKKSTIKNKFNIFSLILYITINMLVVCFLPQNYKLNNGIVNFYDKYFDYIYVITFIHIGIWGIKFLTNHNKFKSKKIIPIIFFVLLITFFHQEYFSNIIFVIAIETFINFLMYFTIENPDIKLLTELNLAKKQAERANIVKTEFLSSMSHEIRTPLNAIVGLGQVLLTENIGENAKNEVREILSSSENLLEIVNSVLDISKIESNKLEIVNTEYNFNKLFYELVNLIKNRIDKNEVEIKSHISNNIPNILYGDEIRIKQLILNLLTNSAKYTKKGVIEFNVDCVIENDICKLIISVKDTGIGIKEEDINKLFNKFQRLDIRKNMTTNGVGLGLAITKKLVDLMKGKITASSVYGQGSCFNVEISQKIISRLEEVDTSQKEIVIDGKNKKILLVDDNVINLKIATRLLEKYGFEISSVLSGKECLDLIENKNKYDLIFLDDMMPEMSGTETLKILRKKENFNIPVVALTANAISGMREKYLNDGFDEYLAKPIIRDELEIIMKKLLT